MGAKGPSREEKQLQEEQQEELEKLKEEKAQQLSEAQRKKLSLFRGQLSGSSSLIPGGSASGQTLGN